MLNCPSNKLTMEHRWLEVQDLLAGLPPDITNRPRSQWTGLVKLARMAAEHIARGRVTGEICVALAQQFLTATQANGQVHV